jgi:hypothetical protein
LNSLFFLRGLPGRRRGDGADSAAAVSAAAAVVLAAAVVVPAVDRVAGDGDRLDEGGGVHHRVGPEGCAEMLENKRPY